MEKPSTLAQLSSNKFVHMFTNALTLTYLTPQKRENHSFPSYLWPVLSIFPRDPNPENPSL